MVDTVVCGARTQTTASVLMGDDNSGTLGGLVCNLKNHQQLYTVIDLFGNAVLANCKIQTGRLMVRRVFLGGFESCRPQSRGSWLNGERCG